MQSWPDEHSHARTDMLYIRCCAMSLARRARQREPRAVVQNQRARASDFAQRIRVCEVRFSDLLVNYLDYINTILSHYSLFYH